MTMSAAGFEPPPKNLDVVCEEARASLRAALLSGQRCLTVDAGMASLDVSGRGFDAPVFARFALEISRALTVLDGPLLLLLPGLAAVGPTRELMENDAIWPAEDRARLRISSSNSIGKPAPGEAPPAAVIVAGLASVSDVDDSSFRDARAWLKAADVSICLNARLAETAAPVEMAGAEAAYCLMTYTIAKTDTYREDADLYQENAGSAVLWRKFPDPWRVLIDTGNSGEWDQIAELPSRPDANRLSDLCLPLMQKRQAAIDALGTSAAAPAASISAMGAGATAAGAGASRGEGGAATSLGDDAAPGSDRVDGAGVVTLSMSDVQRPGAFGPTALYGAVAILRSQALGTAASFDQDRDALGIHLILPSRAEDVEAAWEASYPKLKGPLTATCHLIPEAYDGTPGLAALEQIAVMPGAEAAAVASVIERAMAEAAVAGQLAVLVTAFNQPLDGSAAADCLASLGFEAVGPGTPPDVAAALGDTGGRYKMLGRRAALNAAARRSSEPGTGSRRSPGGEGDAPAEPSQRPEPLETAPDALRVDAEALGGVDGSTDETAPPQPEEGEEEAGDAATEPFDGDEDDLDRMPGASSEDVERLKRMFGAAPPGDVE